MKLKNNSFIYLFLLINKVASLAIYFLKLLTITAKGSFCKKDGLDNPYRVLK